MVAPPPPNTFAKCRRPLFATGSVAETAVLLSLGLLKGSYPHVDDDEASCIYRRVGSQRHSQRRYCPVLPFPTIITAAQQHKALSRLVVVVSRSNDDGVPINTAVAPTAKTGADAAADAAASRRPSARTSTASSLMSWTMLRRTSH